MGGNTVCRSFEYLTVTPPVVSAFEVVRPTTEHKHSESFCIDPQSADDSMLKFVGPDVARSSIIIQGEEQPKFVKTNVIKSSIRQISIARSEVHRAAQSKHTSIND